ncbi:hypothetical protein EDB81DRAFT_28211 [Dactylonectria macrodidyma]|uniref:Uncharacterized protein n=1 Tax=Dactylonectria macrodidyma TaxID=307937 RepID=A0A9P9JIS7_9HYPO|nr:hypothetical protein EDB81DRAFT_28211 [Dactylonectria macrodidyma]
MMRRRDRNPARPGDPYPIRPRTSTEDNFFDFVVRRPLHPKIAERRLQRLDEEEEEERLEQEQHGESHIAQQQRMLQQHEQQHQRWQQQQVQQQQEQSRAAGTVLLGSVPLSQPTPPTPASHQSQSQSLVPTTGFLTPSDQGLSQPQDVFAQSSQQSFLGPNPFSPTNNANPFSPATPAQAPATLSPDTNTAPLNLGSLAVTQTEPVQAGPNTPAPGLSFSMGVGSQAPAPAPGWQSGFFIIGQDLVAQRWDVTVHFQLHTSAISPRVVQHHGFTLETGPPGWNNFVITTPGGLVQPQHFVRGVTVMSTSNWLPIQPMQDVFIVMDLAWTGGDVVLAKPILTRILNNT